MPAQAAAGQSGAPRPGQEEPASRLLAVNFAACLLLLIQYLLGMAVNLYVVLPAAHPGAAVPDYFTGALALACYLSGMFLAARPHAATRDLRTCGLA